MVDPAATHYAARWARADVFSMVDREGKSALPS
jgi:hypothetical protein